MLVYRTANLEIRSWTTCRSSEVAPNSTYTPGGLAFRVGNGYPLDISNRSSQGQEKPVVLDSIADRI